MGCNWLFRLDWGDHPITPGRLVYLLKVKFRDGLRVAYYRDAARPMILSAPPLDLPYLIDRIIVIRVIDR